MTPSDPRTPPSRAVVAWRIAWTLATLIGVQAIVCGISAAPVVLIWQWLPGVESGTARWAFISLGLAPSYVVFACCLMIVSPLAMRLLGWQTPRDCELAIADLDWPLLHWIRFGASIHLVRIVAGTLFRGTPLWTTHLRLNGARLGRRVYINSLSVSDYNLIECGHDVVIGGGVQMSGHTVESGFVKTAPIRIGDDVTIGLESVIEIGVEIGSHTQIGALSFVPKHTRLAGGQTYTGIPAAPLKPTR